MTFDYFFSDAIFRASESNPVKPNLCRVRDPVRHHAVEPNCAFVEPWGRETLEFFTNSLGLRDEKVRDVPLSEARPRILMLGNSFTEGMIAWRDSYVGRIAAHFPQYDFLNGGMNAYSASNHLNTARMVLAAGVELDEVIVFIDASDLGDEAAFYHDVDSSGAVAGPAWSLPPLPWYSKNRMRITKHLLITSSFLSSLDQMLIGHGYYHFAVPVDPFDSEWTAWTYRKVDEIDTFPVGYAPLGVEGGIAKERAKMSLLWQELAKRNIPISVVVYPLPAQLVHDTADSRLVRMWREWCEGKCKRFISLFPAFFAVKDQCPLSQAGCWYQSLFIFGDAHYATAGNAVVADVVIKNLTENPPIKRSGTNLRPESRPARGAH